MELPYDLLDVFTTRPLTGNPLAVVRDARGLSDAQMQAVARELNLSETSFVLPSATCDVRARFFTPTTELPTAGHPSVGTVYALYQRGLFRDRERVTLELQAGPTEMRLERRGDALARVWMDQGVPVLGETFDKGAVARALGLGVAALERDLPVQLGSAGNPFLLVPVASLEALAAVTPSHAALAEVLGGAPVGVFAFTQNAGAPGVRVRARMFGEALGVREDPATGSAHGPLAAYLAAHTDLLRGAEAAFVSHQGLEMGRPSELFVRLRRTPEGVAVAVGGAAVRVGEGRLFLAGEDGE
ncbi:PhzF family phenazine biosynthesis protein [Truepera radiovictrix]|uniref:Phenazine biosynthesis protein PhzF family n=1 Tax=Truepera radiovictrix (strain DSM 17093 / CIP 108686 / LMG 22925 / RQ-24) TaxID=649638 RepID=D7CX48_TRURR|nr:PhzF family phenazine biosynthesis protein [Truepera radiovictrix]ADI14556.1 phenazine biosynthesis protein PhzF family [Truepera radiovictrix DSM 17093]WMT56894.1 PhzF family phenazine biosynthesis protein [Truepera radiovictrix]